MAGVAAKAAELGLAKPCFTWSCVVSDRIAGDLLGYVHFGLSCGVRDFSLCNLTKYDDLDGAENVQHVTTLSDGDLTRFFHSLEAARNVVTREGGTFFVQSGLTDTALIRGSLHSLIPSVGCNLAAGIRQSAL
jgi:hypothetical protein